MTHDVVADQLANSFLAKFFEDGDVERPVFSFDGGHVFLEAQVGDVVGLLGLFFELHVGLEWRFVSFLEVAFSATGDEVFPGVGAASPAGDDMIEGEVAG